jgi:NADPH2:quinone reductase
MEAMCITSFGGPEVFERRRLPRPEAGPGEVVIRVAASSVNRIDIKIRSGQVPDLAPELPAVLHGDVSGTVEAVGQGVHQLQPGDKVFACAGGVGGIPGALAPFMAADADLVALAPQSLRLEQAAALPLVSLTAWEALMDKARVQPGHRVLVHGGTGGVGHIGLQLAKEAGAEVHVTASSREKLEQAFQLGADKGINYRESSVEAYVHDMTGDAGYDVVFDTVGGDNLDRSLQAAGLNASVVSTVTRSWHDLSPLHGKALSLHAVFMLIPLLHGLGRKRHGEVLQGVAQLVDSGRLTPLLDGSRFPFSRAAEAHDLVESGRHEGKVVLVNDLSIE